jgi:hypothetical protein
MKAAIGRLFRRLDPRETEREIEDQLCFHLELMTQAMLQQEMSSEEAKEAAIKRFGNVERIKAQCVEISNRNHPFLCALKSLLILVALVGGLVRFLGADYHVIHIGEVLIMVGVLGRLLLYVRGLNPSSVLSKPEPSSPLMLNSVTQAKERDAWH